MREAKFAAAEACFEKYGIPPLTAEATERIEAEWQGVTPPKKTRGKAGCDDPAVTSCAIHRTLCTEFIRSKTWEFWYAAAERFDDEGESGATLERPRAGEAASARRRG